MKQAEYKPDIENTGIYIEGLLQFLFLKRALVTFVNVHVICAREEGTMKAELPHLFGQLTKPLSSLWLH